MIRFLRVFVSRCLLPGSKLKPLKDDRAGQHSILINDQYRVCFIWSDAGAEQVEVTDYH